MLFFFNTLRILRGFHFFALECPIIKFKGRTARTTASTTIVGTIFGQLLLPAGCTHKFIVPAGGEGTITACFAWNFMCIRPVAS